MINPEKSSVESKEKKSIKEVAIVAVRAVENKDANDPILSSQFMDSAKIAGFALFGASLLGLSIIKGVYKFAKEAIHKKGNVGFKGGYEIGKEIFSIDKKDKK